ncbi:MAG: hypothetical protein LJE68_18240 [Rhodobacter sp.]|nr:hypothetical protein [Rhodobacter sp.]
MPRWWSFILFMALVIGLAGCDSPSMAFQGVPATRITVAGAAFSVHHTRHEAEAIGLTFQPGARRRTNVIRGVAAIEAVSGCPVVVRSVRGDANIVAADLNCAGVPARVIRDRAELDCLGHEVGGIAGDGLIEIDCEIRRRR